MRLSARNQIPARVTRITSGEAIANVELDANGSGWWPPSPSRRSATSASPKAARSPQ
jgi:TOBE domain